MVQQRRLRRQRDPLATSRPPLAQRGDARRRARPDRWRRRRRRPRRGPGRPASAAGAAPSTTRRPGTPNASALRAIRAARSARASTATARSDGCAQHPLDRHRSRPGADVPEQFAPPGRERGEGDRARLALGDLPVVLEQRVGQPGRRRSGSARRRRPRLRPPARSARRAGHIAQILRPPGCGPPRPARRAPRGRESGEAPNPSAVRSRAIAPAPRRPRSGR